MKTFQPSRFVCLIIVVLAMSLSACGGGGGGGDSPTRYNPGPVATPTDVVALAGDDEVALSWPAAQNASAYNVYWSTSPAVDKSSSSVKQTTGTSLIVTGLTNGATYYFVVTAVAAYTETAVSPVVSAQPVFTAPGLVDLDGTWNFNILVSGLSTGLDAGPGERQQRRRHFQLFPRQLGEYRAAERSVRHVECPS